MTEAERIESFAAGREEARLKNREPDIFATDCDIIKQLLDNCRIYIDPSNSFFPRFDVGGAYWRIYNSRIAKYEGLYKENGLDAGIRAFAYTGELDFGHTSPDWEDVISLGVYGLRQRIDEYAARPDISPHAAEYYRITAEVYDAVLRFMARAADLAESEGFPEMAKGLRALCHRSPETLYEAMQTSVLFFLILRYVDRSMPRTLGRLDSLFYPYYKKESRQTVDSLVPAYLSTMDAIKDTYANIPFALCGTDDDGNDLTNELSYILLEAYKNAGYKDLKLHILVSELTPDSLLTIALDSIRSGNNSIIFLSDGKIIESLERLGESHADASHYHVVGCYECGGRNEVTCSCNARVNITKALEYALSGGRDMISGEMVGLDTVGGFDSFNALWDEFSRQLTHLCGCAMTATDIWEEKTSQLHSTPIFSATYVSSLEMGGDIYCHSSARYCNSSLNAIGLATAADSLYAIKKLVFDDGEISLGELTDILRSDWQGHEVLRLRCKNRLEKFGNGDPEADGIAKRIVDILDEAVSGRPNKKGGCYRLGLFSINWRHAFGEHTAASADGRRRGEVLSQNSGATFGAAREGATAHLMSVASLDASRTPNGTIADIDLHRSAVEGEAGLNALLSTVRAYCDLGGFGVHFNVLDAEALKEARLHPERYPDLQVRLCGWNVLFASLSDKEKDEFITRRFNNG